MTTTTSPAPTAHRAWRLIPYAYLAILALAFFAGVNGSDTAFGVVAQPWTNFFGGFLLFLVAAIVNTGILMVLAAKLSKR